MELILKKIKKQTIIFFISLLFLSQLAFTQEQPPIADSVIVAAREIIKANNFCALVTLDSTGQPHVRTMNPFTLGDNLDIWFATARKSRKVDEIKNDERVCVYYADHTNAKGYVTIVGKAVVIDDKELLIKKKRAYWDGIPNWQERFVLIKIVPVSVEVINYQHNLLNDPETLGAPIIEL